MTKFPTRRLRVIVAAAGLAAVLSITAGCSSAVTSGSGGSATGADEDEGTQSGAVSPLTVAFAWIANAHYAPFYVSKDDGFFEDHGLDVDFIPSGLNAPTASQQVVTGNAQVGVASKFSDVIQANADGADLVVLGCGFQRQVQSVITPKGHPVKKLQDLVGLKIGHQSPTDRIVFEGMAKNEGLTLDLVQVGTDPTVLKDGTVDAYIGYAANAAVALELGGFPVDTTLVGDLGWHDYGDCLIVSRDYLEQNRELLVGFLAALTQGYEADVADPEPGAKAAVDTYGADMGLSLDAELAGQKFYIEAMQSEYADEHGLMSMDLDYVKDTVYPFLSDYLGYKPDQLPEPDTYIDLSLLEEAQESLDK